MEGRGPRQHAALPAVGKAVFRPVAGDVYNMKTRKVEKYGDGTAPRRTDSRLPASGQSRLPGSRLPASAKTGFRLPASGFRLPDLYQ